MFSSSFREVQPALQALVDDAAVVAPGQAQLGLGGGAQQVHTLSKMLSPAAEAFRYFVLERGEAFMAEHFGRYMTIGGG